MMDKYYRRTALMNKMEEIVVSDISDEELYEHWRTEGIPDGADLDDLVAIAKDDQSFIEVVRAFWTVVQLDHEGKKD